jgi:hypothetical protein
LNYIEVKQLIERRQLNNKEGKLTDGEIKLLVKDWHDQRAEEELNQTTVEMEMKAMEKTLALFNVEQLGDIPIRQEDRMMRILVCQMGGMASKEVREFKKAATKRLIKKYNINVCLCMELNFNWSKINPLANLASWLHEEREVRSITAQIPQNQTSCSHDTNQEELG